MPRPLPLFLLGLLMVVLIAACSEDQMPTAAKTHPSQWNDKGAEAFHGAKVVTSGYLSCTSCHGENLTGGSSGVACHDCHATFPHPPQWMNLTSADFHGQAIAAARWDMGACRNCHGADYRGGTSGASCNTCHPGSPEACNTCHGSQTNAAPPEDLKGNTSTASLGVGAHQLHLQRGYSCSTCHLSPATVQDAGHLDGALPAEVLANRSWNRTTATCVAGCHRDATKAYIWNQ